jgi:membrane protease YdiL (CAAX protease family)
MISNRHLLLPYAAPYLAYVGIASIPAETMTMEINYLFRLLITPLLLAWAWRWYCPLRGPRSPLGSILTGTAAGIAGLILWLALLAPFVQTEGASPWSFQGFLLRLLSAGLIVPLFEELMMRGFLFRLALQWDTARKNKEQEPLHLALDKQSINDVVPGAWSWPAIILSTVAFTSGHAMPEWPAAVAYGLLMAWLWVARKDLIACITAHAVTNIALALFVYSTGSWQFW